MPGSLIVKPQYARLTHDTDTFGRMDPYCVVKIGGQSQQTAVCKDGGKNPNWANTSLSFRITTEDIINVEVWDRDSVSKNDMIGQGSLSVGSVTSQGSGTSLNCTLVYKGKAAGEVYIQFEWYSDAAPKKEGAVAAGPAGYQYPPGPYPPQGYQQPVPGYPQPVPGYPQPVPGYQQPPAGPGGYGVPGGYQQQPTGPGGYGGPGGYQQQPAGYGGQGGYQQPPAGSGGFGGPGGYQQQAGPGGFGGGMGGGQHGGMGGPHGHGGMGGGSHGGMGGGPHGGMGGGPHGGMGGGFGGAGDWRMPGHITKKDIKHHREKVFHKFDQDRSGYLNQRELYYAMCELFQMLGSPPPPENYVYQAMRQFDKNGDGRMSLKEFKKFVKQICNFKSKKQKY